MPDISHKDAGFIVLVTVALVAALIIFSIIRVSKYFDRKEPKSLRAVFDKIDLDHQKSNYGRSLSTLLTYLKFIEANPMQHMEIGPVFALIAKTHLRMQHPSEAYYYARISEHYYSLFDVVVEPGDSNSVLIGNLRLDNEKIETQSGLALDPNQQADIRSKINDHNSDGNMRGSADWIRMSPVSELS